MKEKMSTNEQLVKQTEEKMIYKILLTLEESKDLEDAKEKIKQLIKK